MAWAKRSWWRNVALEDEILAALDPDQRAVALATRGPVCVIAGAGTGKTRAITHRIAYAVAIGTMDPANGRRLSPH